MVICDAQPTTHSPLHQPSQHCTLSLQHTASAASSRTARIWWASVASTLSTCCTVLTAHAQRKRRKQKRTEKRTSRETETDKRKSRERKRSRDTDSNKVSEAESKLLDGFTEWREILHDGQG